MRSSLNKPIPISLQTLRQTSQLPSQGPWNCWKGDHAMSRVESQWGFCCVRDQWETPIEDTALSSTTTWKCCKLTSPNHQTYSEGQRIAPEGYKSSWKPLMPITFGMPSSMPFLPSYPSRLQCLFFLKYISNCFRLENIFQKPLPSPGASILVPVRIGAWCSAPLTF